MKFVDEFRDGAIARGLAETVARETDPARRYSVMEFCGGHTHAVFRFGLPELLPPNVRLVHGPGCPVCVLPLGRLDAAIALARTPGVTLCSYGDMLRVPGSDRESLLTAKAAGADVRIVYSVTDALKLARERRDRTIVFFAIGFETTTPPTAVAIQEAHALGLDNFSVFCNHVLTPAAIQHVLESPEVRKLGSVPIDAFIGPGHVSAIIGTRPFEYFAEEYRRPVAIAGFEPVDLLRAILLLVRQINEGRFVVENGYDRAVDREGNLVAQLRVAEVFELRRSFEWRGLGVVPYSGLRIKKEFAAFDAERRFEIPQSAPKDPNGCICGAILRGFRRPTDCDLFGAACTPENPIGSCMVSSEGACAAYYRYASPPARA